MKDDLGRVPPWPLDELRRRLLEGDTLHRLTRSKQTSKTHDVREIELEDLAQEVMIAAFGRGSVVTRRAIGHTLGIRSAPFPGRARPDIAVRHAGKIHVLELKSSRVDYRRFDNEFRSAPFRAFLRCVGDAGRIPWEVEQDLIKLSLYPRLSEAVGSCVFLMLDAYEGRGRSWTAAFGSPTDFRDTMRTQLVRGWAEALLRTTKIERVATGAAKARLITCVVPPAELLS